MKLGRRSLLIELGMQCTRWKLAGRQRKRGGGGSRGERERMSYQKWKKSTLENCILSNNFTNFSWREEGREIGTAFANNNQ
jgi:hypothetical protein